MFGNNNKAILRDALKGVSVPSTLKMSDRRWYQMKDTKDPNDDFLTQTIEAMKASSNSIILDHICEEAGGCFVPYEEGGKKSRNVHMDLSNMLKEVSDVWTVCAKSLDDDGEIDINEAVSIRKEAKEAMAAITSFLDNLEAGRY